jgi:hypothetical protein
MTALFAFLQHSSTEKCSSNGVVADVKETLSVEKLTKPSHHHKKSALSDSLCKSTKNRNLNV